MVIDRVATSMSSGLKGSAIWRSPASAGSSYSTPLGVPEEVRSSRAPFASSMISCDAIVDE